MSTKSEIKQIKTTPDPFEAFNLSQAIAFGDLIFVSGQAALDLEGNIIGEGDFEIQAEASIKNLEKVLQAGGSDLSKVIKVTIFMKDMKNFPKVIELRKKFFKEPYPADSIVEVSSLALPELEFEIEAIATT